MFSKRIYYPAHIVRDCFNNDQKRKIKHLLKEHMKKTDKNIYSFNFDVIKDKEKKCNGLFYIRNRSKYFVNYEIPLLKVNDKIYINYKKDTNMAKEDYNNFSSKADTLFNKEELNKIKRNYLLGVQNRVPHSPH